MVSSILMPLLLASVSFASDEGFVPIFNGKSLTGWLGQDMSFWTIEDEAITGTISADHRPPMNQYLVWQGGLVEDFELKLDFRLTGSTTPDTNGGFQFRSRRLPNGDVAGYQVDNNFGQPWKVRLYDEFGRHDLAVEGEKATFSREGKRSAEALALASGARDFHLDEWHEYHLIAIGDHLKLHINGKLVAEAFDHDIDSAEARGILAMQLHTGPPMKAQFKNIRLKPIKVNALDSRDALFAHASLHWSMRDRLNAHQPPLAAVGEVSIDPEVGARFRKAYVHAQVDLNQPRVWNSPGRAMTLYVRATLPDLGQVVCYFSKGGLEPPGHYWLGLTPSEEGKSRLTFALKTNDGPKRLDIVLPPGKSPDELHDVVAIYDGQEVALFLDDVKLAHSPATGDLLPNDAAILMGASAADKEPSHLFTGVIQEVALWPRALSAKEVGLVCQNRRINPKSLDSRDR